MSRLEHAVVVGAGMGGLAAAGALANHFKRVSLLERNALGNEPRSRSGVPQSNQLHFLLQGGLTALGEIFTGFDQDLVEAGAVPLRVGLEDRKELPGFDPFPQMDLGMRGLAMSRPFLEQVLRKRVIGFPNVILREQCRVREITIGNDGFVSGVVWDNPDGSSETQQADLVVDASARGQLTMASLSSAGLSAPEQTTIGVDIRYATATFTLPERPRDWKMVATFPDLRVEEKAGVLMPIEGNRWMASMAEWHGETVLTDQASFLEFSRSLRTQTIYSAIKEATSFGNVERYNFPESYQRHYEVIPDFPRGLIPLGDAICRFNPIYGQGMSVAAREAALLGKLLNRTTNVGDLVELTPAFLQEAASIISTAWTLAAVPDFVTPKTRGVRPVNLGELLEKQQMLTWAAARDPLINKLMLEVRHLVKHPNALNAPEILHRLEKLHAAKV